MAKKHECFSASLDTKKSNIHGWVILTIKLTFEIKIKEQKEEIPLLEILATSNYIKI